MVPSRLFRSRRSALFWAGGVLWTAYDVASGQPRSATGAQVRTAAPAAGLDATGEAVNSADLATLANAMRLMDAPAQRDPGGSPITRHLPAPSDEVRG